MKKLTVLQAIAVAALLGSGIAIAEEAAKAPAETQAQNRQMLGKDLMSQEERDAQRNMMRKTTTAEEREKIRAEQHEKMKERAAEQGKTIPDEPYARGQGGGQGNGSGRGGMGGGGGRGGR
ncbi:MAG: hypothetical protein Q8J80_06305 [Gallionella sp.]|nr:hypothetical protein [Gallionella sp.]